MIRNWIVQIPTWILKIIDKPVHLINHKGLYRRLHDIDVIYEICLELELRSLRSTDSYDDYS